MVVGLITLSYVLRKRATHTSKQIAHTKIDLPLREEKLPQEVLQTGAVWPPHGVAVSSPWQFTPCQAHESIQTGARSGEDKAQEKIQLEAGPSTPRSPASVAPPTPSRAEGGRGPSSSGRASSKAPASLSPSSKARHSLESLNSRVTIGSPHATPDGAVVLDAASLAPMAEAGGSECSLSYLVGSTPRGVECCILREYAVVPTPAALQVCMGEYGDASVVALKEEIRRLRSELDACQRQVLAGVMGLQQQSFQDI